METVVNVKHISKRFGQQLALDDVSLTVKQGEIYGLIGKNGAGKTTLIKVITQLIQPNSGTIALFGSSNKSEWTHALKRVGSVIEAPAAYNHLTAYENLNYCCKIRHIPNADKVIRETLSYVGLTNTGKKKFRDFSLGMKQRLGIAIALLSKPDLMILDEPINGLDPIGIREMRDLFVNLVKTDGMTLLISSHILTEVEHIADIIGVIVNGTIIREVPMAKVKAEYPSGLEDYFMDIMTGRKEDNENTY